MTRRVFTIVTLVVAVLIAAPAQAHDDDEPSEGGYASKATWFPRRPCPVRGPILQEPFRS